MKRRALLTTLGAAGPTGLAGCSLRSNDDPPAGSLQFENEDELPHVIRVAVAEVGERPDGTPETGLVTGDVIVPPTQRELTAATSLTPGETQSFSSAFTEPVWYAVEFSLDDRRREDGRSRIAFNPAPPERDYWSVLSAAVTESGGFSWHVSSTDDSGNFPGEIRRKPSFG